LIILFVVALMGQYTLRDKYGCYVILDGLRWIIRILLFLTHPQNKCKPKF
jgi:NhaP-type Na+/H+ and K+/H+ antiporter